LAPQLLCEACATPLEGVPLGAGSATAIFTLEQLDWATRDICDNINAELGRPSLWAEVSTVAPDIP
jgi:hypothetical protein